MWQAVNGFLGHTLSLVGEVKGQLNVWNVKEPPILFWMWSQQRLHWDRRVWQTWVQRLQSRSLEEARWEKRWSMRWREKTEWLGGDELAQPSLHGLKKWSGAKAKGVILKTTVKKSSLLITGVRGYVSFLWQMATFRMFSILGPWAANASSIITNDMPLPPSIYPLERMLLALGKILM